MKKILSIIAFAFVAMTSLSACDLFEPSPDGGEKLSETTVPVVTMEVTIAPPETSVPEVITTLPQTSVPEVITTPPQTSVPEAITTPAETTKPAVTTEVSNIPENDGSFKIGDTLCGFTVMDIMPMDMLESTGILFEHEKSGAQLLYLDSEDTNRSFDISFRTPALDDKGKPHVFEHITISGSEKYPDANIFFPIIYKTYNTFINAMTAHGMTTFPVASLSEDQLMTMMDYYLSGVFHPLLYTEPKLVEREAWRYELMDADADINIAGTVYSEMQGYMSVQSQASDNSIRTLYEGSTTAHSSGGIPEYIRTLTYDELVEFHDTYYHPSNALITLYGDLDVTSFLKYIDSEYLKDYEKKDVEVDMGRVAPITHTKYAEYEVPVEQGSIVEKASEVDYSFALNGADLHDTLSVDILSSVILQDASPVMQSLRECLPEAQINGGINIDSPSAPYFTISAYGIDPEDRDTFVNAVDQGLAKLAEEGISDDVLDSIMSTLKLSAMTMSENSDLGVSASMSIALGWTYFDTVDFFSVQKKVINEITTEKLSSILSRYITDNRHRAVSVTKPVAGLAEQNAEELEKTLKEKKSEMSAEEIEALVNKSNDFIEWGNQPASDELVSKVANMNVSDLPEEIRHYDITDETVNDVRYMSTAASANDIFSGRIMLDGSTIPVENLQDAQVYLSLMGSLGTKEHSMEEISVLASRYLQALSMTLTSTDGYEGADGYYAASISWMGLTEDATTATSLLKELLLDTDLTDTDMIKSILARQNALFQMQIDNNPLSIQFSRCAAMFNDKDAYYTFISGYAMQKHIQELIELIDSDPDAFISKITTAKELLLNRNGATVLLTGNDDAIAAYRDAIEDIFSCMKNESREKVDYSVLRLPKRNEGIVNNTTVQMNCMFSEYLNYTCKDNVVTAFVDDVYMLPKLRNALGAYGAYSGFSNSSSALYTYNDPNLSGSYDIFSELPEYLRSEDITQEDVDSYIIGAYSNISRPVGQITGAMDAMEDRLTGRSEEIRLRWLREAKSTTPDDIKASADAWDCLIKNGVRSTSGTESALIAAGDLFDVLIYPDGSEKALGE